MATAIEFNHVSKQYRLGFVSTRTLSHDLDRWFQTSILRREDPYLKIGEVNDRASKGSSEYVWALRDIDFKVEQGDVVGIIGKNGAGKSTLLKLLSKVTAPTTGTIRARGRIASLLEVGTGFHQEMTGRENIYMNGAILGMTKQEITSKLDEIVAFSGCERYLDTPVKRYSSGMMVRLGFAVAAHLDPEILVVDEVLAVGDAEFQKKAIGKMQDISHGEGRTVLFVSHNMASMKALCNHGVLLEQGMVRSIGDMGEVISEYQRISMEKTALDILTREDRFGTGKVKLQNIEILNADDEPIDSISVGSEFHIRVTLKNYAWQSTDFVQELCVGINDEYGQRNFIMNNIFIDKNITISPNITNYTFIVKKCPLNIGNYSMAFFLSDKMHNVVDAINNVGCLHVESGDFYGMGKCNRYGLGRFIVPYDLQ